jgi:hypothetical protein
LANNLKGQSNKPIKVSQEFPQSASPINEAKEAFAGLSISAAEALVTGGTRFMDKCSGSSGNERLFLDQGKKRSRRGGWPKSIQEHRGRQIPEIQA